MTTVAYAAGALACVGFAVLFVAVASLAGKGDQRLDRTCEDR